MQSVRNTATAVLRTLLQDQPTTAAKVTFAWQIAAGTALSRAAECSWSEDGILVIRTRDAAWKREIQRARPLIAHRLGELLGPDVVRSIVIRDESNRE
jgi:hypothetical protein